MESTAQTQDINTGHIMIRCKNLRSANVQMTRNSKRITYNLFIICIPSLKMMTPVDWTLTHKLASQRAILNETGHLKKKWCILLPAEVCCRDKSVEGPGCVGVVCVGPPLSPTLQVLTADWDCTGLLELLAASFCWWENTSKQKEQVFYALMTYI